MSPAAVQQLREGHNLGVHRLGHDLGLSRSPLRRQAARVCLLALLLTCPSSGLPLLLPPSLGSQPSGLLLGAQTRLRGLFLQADAANDEPLSAAMRALGGVPPHGQDLRSDGRDGWRLLQRSENSNRTAYVQTHR